MRKLRHPPRNASRVAEARAPAVKTERGVAAAAHTRFVGQFRDETRSPTACTRIDRKKRVRTMVRGRALRMNPEIVCRKMFGLGRLGSRVPVSRSFLIVWSSWTFNRPRCASGLGCRLNYRTWNSAVSSRVWIDPRQLQVVGVLVQFQEIINRFLLGVLHRDLLGWFLAGLVSFLSFLFVLVAPLLGRLPLDSGGIRLSGQPSFTSWFRSSRVFLVVFLLCLCCSSFLFLFVPLEVDCDHC